MKLAGFLTTLSLFSAASVAAQDATASAETFFLGSTQPTVVKLPLPSYPDGARKARLEGVVSIEVVVDEKGKVIPIKDVAGPYPVCQAVTDPNVLAMREAAKQAVEKAKFNPAVDDREVLRATGWIKYQFAIEKKKGDVADTAVVLLGTSDSDSGVRMASPNDPLPQPASVPKGLPKVVSGGVLNGTAMQLAKPSYPSAARAVRASGPVSVQVLIAEDGSLFSAQAVSGHPLLRRSSEIAACDSRFKPTLLEGQPVKVSGVITYNYVP